MVIFHKVGAVEKEMVGITRYSLNPCFLLLKYIFKVLPEARKQRSYWKHVLKELMSDRDLSFLLSQCFKGRDSLIHFLYSLYFIFLDAGKLPGYVMPAMQDKG